MNIKNSIEAAHDKITDMGAKAMVAATNAVAVCPDGKEFRSVASGRNSLTACFVAITAIAITAFDASADTPSLDQLDRPS